MALKFNPKSDPATCLVEMLPNNYVSIHNSEWDAPKVLSGQNVEKNIGGKKKIVWQGHRAWVPQTVKYAIIDDTDPKRPMARVVANRTKDAAGRDLVGTEGLMGMMPADTGEKRRRGRPRTRAPEPEYGEERVEAGETDGEDAVEAE